MPIDFMGGTSIGSFVGGMYCSDPEVGRATQSAREWFMVCSMYLRFFVLIYSISGHVVLFELPFRVHLSA